MSISTVSSGFEQSGEKYSPRFYVVSIRKMVFMMFLTWGVYAMYWHYRNWATYKRATGDKVIPILRALFAIFFLYPLLRRVDRGLQTKGLECRCSPGLLTLGTVLVILLNGILPGLLDPALNSPGWISNASNEAAFRSTARLYLVVLPLFSLQIWLMVLMQRAINLHEGDVEGDGNAELTKANWAWMVPGTLIWVINMLSLAVLFWSVAL